MWIDRKETFRVLPAAAFLPKDQLRELLPFAFVEREEDECCRIVSQHVRLGWISIWHQRVHPKTDMELRPQTPFPNIILHFMMGSDVTTRIKDDELVVLSGGFMDMFNLTRYPNVASLVKGQDFDSLHINIQPKKVKAMAKLFPELAVLKTPMIMKTDGPLRRNKKPLPISDTSWMMIRDILTCRYIGDAAHFYLQRIAVNLLTTYVKLMDTPEHHGLSENIEQKVRKCFAFLREEYVAQHAVKDLAALFGINARVLHEGFGMLYGCTASEFQYAQRMRLAYRSLIETKAPMSLIAEKTGFASLRSFLESFRSYFKCDPVWLLKAQ